MWLSSVIVQSKVGIRRNTKPFTTLFPRVGGRVNQSADFKFDTHILFSTHTFFPFTWCADFTYYFYIFEKRKPVKSREIEDMHRTMSDNMSEYFYDGDIMTFIIKIENFSLWEKKRDTSTSSLSVTSIPVNRPPPVT